MCCCCTAALLLLPRRSYIHPFIFSLATIIPMPPDEVLRKGSGTLCEQLLMVEAYRANVICPNKHTSQVTQEQMHQIRQILEPAHVQLLWHDNCGPASSALIKWPALSLKQLLAKVAPSGAEHLYVDHPIAEFAAATAPVAPTVQAEVLYKNHLLESETYIGGKVEALESGVFRADLPTRFKCKAAAYQGLIDNLDRDLGYAIRHDGGWELADAENYEEVKAAITEKLEALRDAPNRWDRQLLERGS
jgi:hypothetical protein